MCGISSSTSDGAIKNIYRWVVMLLQAMWLICPNSCHPLHWDHHLLPFIQTLEPRHSLDDICRWAWSHTGLHISLYTGFHRGDFWELGAQLVIFDGWASNIFLSCLHNLVVFDYWRWVFSLAWGPVQELSWWNVHPTSAEHPRYAGRQQTWKDMVSLEPSSTRNWLTLSERHFRPFTTLFPLPMFCFWQGVHKSSFKSSSWYERLSNIKSVSINATAHSTP